MADRQRLTSYLVYRIDGGPEEIIIWDTLDITVGRFETQDIVLTDPEISRQHAVFRKSGDSFSVKALNTTLGMLVNEKATREHQLQPGDTVRIGPLELEFGQTADPLKPGPNTRYASHLKGFGLPPGTDGGGTVLGFSPPPEPFETVPPPGPPVARAVSASGELEEIEKVDDLAPPGVSDLDPVLADSASHAGLDLYTRADAPALEHRDRLELLVEVEGPELSIRSLASALVDKTITVPPLEIRVSTRPPR